MAIIAPDILTEGRDFSVGFCAAGVAIGTLLWITGWRAHRFWIVLLSTVTAGIIGLQKAPAFGVQPPVAALLLASAAGLLALALVRVIAFVAGGIAAVYAVRLLPPAPWQEPIVCFFGGGLIGLVLFRIWTMMLTSFAGTVLMGYFGLWLADRLGQINSVTFATEQPGFVNGLCGVATLVGFIIQFLFDRRSQRRLRDEMEYRRDRGWRRFYDRPRWLGGGRRPYRRAG